MLTLILNLFMKNEIFQPLYQNTYSSQVGLNLMRLSHMFLFKHFLIDGIDIFNCIFQ